MTVVPKVLPPDEHLAYRVWISTIIVTVLATVAVVARFLARHLSNANLWLDDWTILIALVLNWILSALRWVQIIKCGLGRHIWYVGAAREACYWKYFLAVQAAYLTSAAVCKISFLLLFFRLFGIIRPFKNALFVTGFLVIGFWIATIVTSIAGCHPISYFWNTKQPGGCINEIAFFRWNGICNLLLDAVVLCLPLPMVWKLKVEVKQKIILSAIFLLGGFVCAASIIRIIMFNVDHSDDGTYTSINVASWSSIEQGFGVACACLPTLKPLFGRFFSGTTNVVSSTTDPRSRTDNFYELSKSGKSGRMSLADDSSQVRFAPMGLADAAAMPIYGGRGKGGNTVTASAEGAGGGRAVMDDDPARVPRAHILKKQTIDQRSEVDMEL